MFNARIINHSNGQFCTHCMSLSMQESPYYYLNMCYLHSTDVLLLMFKHLQMLVVCYAQSFFLFLFVIIACIGIFFFYSLPLFFKTRLRREERSEKKREKEKKKKRKREIFCCLNCRNETKVDILQLLDCL